MNDPKAVGGDIKAFHGINFADLNTAYHQFCKNESIANPVVDLGQVIEFFNNAAADLPDPTPLKGRKLPSMSVVLDGKGNNFANIFEPRNRRVWIPLSAIPDVVQKAFVAAEDRRFFEHHGVDERGIIRAFIGNFANPGRLQGGSTITQQVVKNLLVGDDVTYERKIREMIVASRVESTLSKPEILELYLNSAYLGRGSWGVEMAARSYFGKSAKNLTLAEGAMLAGLLKGPSFFNPDRHPERAKERLAYVLGRMQEDGVISAEDKDHALAAPPKLVAFEQKRRDSGLHFIDFLGREAKSDGVASLIAEPYTVHSTINATLQREAEAALQEGLARYEMSAGRTQFRGPEANIGDAIQKLMLGRQSGTPLPAWQQALQELHLPLYDVHWEPAVILDRGGKRGDGVIRVGLRDGRVLPLTNATAQVKRAIGPYDIVYVHVVEPKPAAKPKTSPDPAGIVATAGASPASAGAQAQLRIRPTVQGAALVLENKTGRILAMAGSFSYALSQLNRTAQTQRQPGSAMKPLTYLTALQSGLQPNTLVRDDPITLPPIGAAHGGRKISAGKHGGGAREEDFWSPRNADNSSGGVFTMRRGLENSVNVVTAHLLDGGISADPEKSLDEVCATAVGGENLQQLHSLLSVRARRATRADDRSCRLLCRGRQRRRAAAAARDRVRSRRTDRQCLSTLTHRYPLSRRLTACPSISSRRYCRVSSRAAPPARLVRCRLMSPARPEPPKMRSTAGSSASPTMSPSPYGSATTMATASAGRLARVQPGQEWRCRSSSPSLRLFGQKGSPQRRRSTGRRRKQSSISLICRLITRAEHASKAAAKLSSSTSGSRPMARSKTRNISWFRVRSLCVAHR